MARQLFLFDRPRRFVAGTVGTPGDRTFYLQAADAARVVSVAVEKQQVAVLADRIEQLLDEIVAQAPVEDTEIAQETLLEDVDEGPDALRVRLEPASAREFVTRARAVLAAGRPPCPLCGLPLDPNAGHICPRQNGYHRGSALEG